MMTVLLKHVQLNDVSSDSEGDTEGEGDSDTDGEHQHTLRS